LAAITKNFLAFVISIFAAGYVEAGAACSPFRVHLQATLPAAPILDVPQQLPDAWEETIAKKISARSGHGDFEKYYQNWKEKNPRRKNAEERWQWLSCLDYYTSIDSNKNGVPDWSAISDRMPATSLFPQDADQDGDGIANVLDAEPLFKAKPEAAPAGEIPAHLKITRPEAAELQAKLFREFGILAIDHTDKHSPEVLREFLFLLHKGFSKKFIAGLNLKYLYAFAGHDPRFTAASYHGQARALSVAGLHSYKGTGLTEELRLDLLSSLSHEVGHAVLFDKLSTRELAQISADYSGWKPVSNSEIRDEFYSPVFFQPMPENTGKNIVSQYAMKNRHEWFAESFAASIINNLGHSGTLGKNWKPVLRKPAFNGASHWVDYTRISGDFRNWINKLLHQP
jgi:hypothetical protein